MGFPQWTIWGMGICLVLTLIVLGYSLNVQSPRRGAGFQMEPYRREARVRALTVTAFALLLVMVGFFVAGVPIEGQSDPVVVQTNNAGASVALAEATATPIEQSTSISGAFGQALIQEEASATPEPTVETVVEPEGEADADTQAAVDPTLTPVPVAEPSATPTEEPTNIPSPTPTPTLTPSPTPTLTPTPINGEVGHVNTAGSTLWVKRSPGGQNMVIVQDGDLLILLPGNANQGGVAWKQVKTVAGVEGWVEREFIAFAAASGEDDG